MRIFCSYQPGEHRWSGWPGAFCMYCGLPDANEIAIADGDWDPSVDKNPPCPASEEARDRVDKMMNPDWFDDNA